MGLKKVFLLLKDKLLKHVLSNDEKHTRLQREGYTQAFFIIPSITLMSHIALAIIMGTKMTRTVTTAPILSIGNIQSRPIEMRIFQRNERSGISAILGHRRKLF